MTHRLNLLLLVLIALVAVPYYWLMVANPGRGVAPHPVSITQLRRLADEIPGPRPVGIELNLVAWQRLPGNFHAAGSGLKRRQFGIMSFRLPVPGRGPIIIDTGLTAPIAQALNLEAFDPNRQALTDRWLREAGLILATSEQPDHLGGLAALAAQPASARTMAHARLNDWQIPRDGQSDLLTWPSTLVLRPAISGNQPRAIAPGVVVIPTGTPTPGAQMVFVRLGNGQEFVFAGDVAPFHINVSELRVRSNLLERHESTSQRAELMRWLVTLRTLQTQAPGLVVLPGHDIDWLSLEAKAAEVRIITP